MSKKKSSHKVISNPLGKPAMVPQGHIEDIVSDSGTNMSHNTKKQALGRNTDR